MSSIWKKYISSEKLIMGKGNLLGGESLKTTSLLFPFMLLLGLGILSLGFKIELISLELEERPKVSLFKLIEYLDLGIFGILKINPSIIFSIGIKLVSLLVFKFSFIIEQFL